MNLSLVLALTMEDRANWMPTTSLGWFWLIFGVSAQLVFTARFLVQWIASEKKGKSHVPVAFWYLSLLGAGMLLTYAILQQEPVMALGQVTGFVIYVRNLMLISKEKRENDAIASAENPT